MKSISRQKFFEDYIQFSVCIRDMYDSEIIIRKERTDLDDDRCLHPANVYGSLVQCDRKPTKTIGGCGLCWQHARMIRARMKKDRVKVE